MLSVTAPVVAPPIKPAPEFTAVISAELVLSMVIVLPLLVTLMFVPPVIVSFSPLVIASACPDPVSVSIVQLV